MLQPRLTTRISSILYLNRRSIATQAIGIHKTKARLVMSCQTHNLVLNALSPGFNLNLTYWHLTKVSIGLWLLPCQDTFGGGTPYYLSLFGTGVASKLQPRFNLEACIL